LHQLWDSLKEDEPVEGQLLDIISGATIQDAWRKELVQTPAALDYCGNLTLPSECVSLNGPGFEDI
jgi:hypothetical protein